MDEKSLTRKGRIKFLLAVLALGAIVVAEVLAFLVVVFLNIPYESLWTDIVIETLGSLAAIAMVLLLGGRSLVSISRDDVAYTFRFGWWCIAISIVLMILELVWSFEDSTPIASDWPVRLAETVVLCVGIGVMEETVFRGVVLNGLLALLGSTHKGVVRAIVITSVLFGFAHVDVTTDFVDGLSIIQALLKICQTGMYSFMLCVILLRTHRLGGVSLFHGFDDFVLVLPSIALFGEPLETEYVVQGEDAMPTIMYYLVVIVLYLPFVIKSGIELRRGQDVTRGAFMEREVAQAQAQALEVASEVPVVPVSPIEGAASGEAPAEEALLEIPVPTTPQTASDYRPLETLTVPEAASAIPVGVVPSAPGAPETSAPAADRASRSSGLPPVPKGL